MRRPCCLRQLSAQANMPPKTHPYIQIITASQTCICGFTFEEIGHSRQENPDKKMGIIVINHRQMVTPYTYHAFNITENSYATVLRTKIEHVLYFLCMCAFWSVECVMLLDVQVCAEVTHLISLSRKYLRISFNSDKKCYFSKLQHYF